MNKNHLLALVLAAGAATGAFAQANDTLAKAKAAGKVVMGVRESSAPLSFTTGNGQFTGYAPADFMMGFVQNLVTPTVQYQGDVATWRDGFFVLDNWQASRKLTLKMPNRQNLRRLIQARPNVRSRLTSPKQ